MSFFVTEAVIITEGIPPLAKLVLCVLAKHANHDGSNARPSQETIKAMTGMGKSTVAKWLAWLEDAGYIVPDKYDGGGRGHTVEYRICTERLYHVEGLQYKNGVNLLPDGTFSGEKDLPRGKKDPRGGQNLLSGGKKDPRGGQKDLPRRSHSVRDSVSDSVTDSVNKTPKTTHQRSLGSGDIDASEGLASSSFASQNENPEEEEAGFDKVADDYEDDTDWDEVARWREEWDRTHNVQPVTSQEESEAVDPPMPIEHSNGHNKRFKELMAKTKANLDATLKRQAGL